MGKNKYLIRGVNDSMRHGLEFLWGGCNEILSLFGEILEASFDIDNGE